MCKTAKCNPSEILLEFQRTYSSPSYQKDPANMLQFEKAVLTKFPRNRMLSLTNRKLSRKSHYANKSNYRTFTHPEHPSCALAQTTNVSDRGLFRAGESFWSFFVSPGNKVNQLSWARKDVSGRHLAEMSMNISLERRKFCSGCGSTSSSSNILSILDPWESITFVEQQQRLAIWWVWCGKVVCREMF